MCLIYEEETGPINIALKVMIDSVRTTMRATIYAKTNGPWISNFAQYGNIDATSKIDEACALKTVRAMNGAKCVPSGKAKIYSVMRPNSVKFETVHRTTRSWKGTTSSTLPRDVVRST